MTASLQEKNNKYYVVIYYKEDGKNKLKWIKTGLEVKGNKRAAEKIMHEELAKFEKEHAFVNRDVLFADYIRYWLDVVKNKVDIVTYQGYELTARANVIPYFDSNKIKLGDISKYNLQDYFNYKIAHGRKDGKPFAATSIKQFKNIINQTLNLAIKEDLITSNPCQYVELPKTEHFESSFYNAEQLKTLFEAIKGDVLEPLIRITVLYGLRRSEVLGLQWDSIDFESRHLTIKHTVVNTTKRVEKNKTKNNASKRSFVLTDEALEIFKVAKELEAENRKLFGKEYISNNYVFKWDNGKPYEPNFISRHFRKLLEKNNLPHIRFHELRHSCASLLLNNGCTLKDVQEYMGHADINMTANIYGHLDVARKDMLSNEISQAIF